MNKKMLKPLKFQGLLKGSYNCSFEERLRLNWYHSRAGMEMVQVAILVGIAVVVGLIFKTQITSFVNHIFNDLFANF